MKFNLENITIADRPLKEDSETKKANEKLRVLVGGNFKFYFNEQEQEYQLWEQRGPMFQMIISLVYNGVKLNRITDKELKFALGFCLRRRKNNDENFMKYKEYKQWTDPDEYVDWRPKDNPDEWKDTSPTVEGYKRVKKNAVIN